MTLHFGYIEQATAAGIKVSIPATWPGGLVVPVVETLVPTADLVDGARVLVAEVETDEFVIIGIRRRAGD